MSIQTSNKISPAEFLPRFKEEPGNITEEAEKRSTRSRSIESRSRYLKSISKGSTLRRARDNSPVSPNTPPLAPSSKVSILEGKSSSLKAHILSDIPTPEAIDDLNNELDALETSLIHNESEDSYSLTSSARQKVYPSLSIKSNSSTISRTPKENATIKYLMKENGKLRKTLDRCQFDLSQLQTKIRLDSESCEHSESSVQEDVPVVVAALKSKVTESHETISKQKELLEEQDTKIIELERQLRNMSDSLILDQLSSKQLSPAMLLPPSTPPLIKRESILFIEQPTSNSLGQEFPITSLPTSGLDEEVRSFVSSLFTNNQKQSMPTANRDIYSSIVISSSPSRTTVPIYSQVFPEIDYPRSNRVVSPKASSRSSSIYEVVKSMSISSLGREESISKSKLSARPESSIEEEPIISPEPSPNESKAMESAIKGLEQALQDSYQQQTKLHNTITKLQAQQQQLEMTMIQQKESHQQALTTLMDQVERSKLESNSYQRQVQEISRQNYLLNSQLEESNNRIVSLEERKTKFFCF